MSLSLAAVAASCVLAAVPSVSREETEWCQMYWFDTHKTNLPRVLLVGDSIVLGSRSHVAKKLKGKIAIAAFSTSKIVGDDAFLRELKLVLADTPINMICFNNGLHGLNYNADFYRTGLISAIDFLRKTYPQIKLVWRNSTPITVKGKPNLFDKRNTVVLTRNQVAAEVMKERNIPVYDFYSKTAGHPEWSCGDSFHYNVSGWDKIADLTVDMILRELPEKSIKHTDVNKNGN